MVRRLRPMVIGLAVLVLAASCGSGGPDPTTEAGAGGSGAGGGSGGGGAGDPPAGQLLESTWSFQMDSWEGRLHKVDGRVVEDEPTLAELRYELAAYFHNAYEGRELPPDVDVEAEYLPDVDLDTEFVYLAVTSECGIPPEGPWLDVGAAEATVVEMDWDSGYDCDAPDLVFHIFTVDREHRDRFPLEQPPGLAVVVHPHHVISPVEASTELLALVTEPTLLATDEDAVTVSAAIDGNEWLARTVKDSFRSRVFLWPVEGCRPDLAEWRLILAEPAYVQGPDDAPNDEVCDERHLILFTFDPWNDERVRDQRPADWQVGLPAS